MFFDSLKRKSLKRNLEKIIDKGNGPQPSSSLKNAGILLDYTAFQDVSALKQMLQDLKKGVNYEVICHVKNLKGEENLTEGKFDDKAITTQMKIKDAGLKNFVEKPFDLLISYYTSENLPLHCATALSKAKFKVGLPTAGTAVNDLVLNVPLGDVATFREELKKYLKILNRID
ncbi:MAG: hypothetical protein CL868_03290 [Cytophagaceae bacterium]|nr:hypothetical protein [Cytophagaceae bacterium]|tara:strand:- start:939 stop:1457 length:519 start_codon:yes stop_codon:yes gene_type:complete